MEQDIFSKQWWKLALQLDENVNDSNIFNDFLHFAIDDLGITNQCTINFTTDKSITKTYGHYEPSTNTIVIYVKGRGTGDILRTLAHELVHRKQEELDLIEPNSGETGSPIENEANAYAGVLLRKFGEKNPMIYESLILEGNQIFFPSEKFSIDNRINVSKKWNLPEKYNEQLIQNICLNVEKNQDEYIEMAKEILTLNPELLNIRATTGLNLYDIIMGDVSRFNFDDIKFFIEDWKFDTKEGNIIRKNLRDLEKKYSIEFQWIPSPKTLSTIINHLDKLKEGMYGSYLFGDKESGVKIGWYDSEKEEDTPVEKALFDLLKRYADSEETTYSQINLDPYINTLRKLKKQYPQIVEPGISNGTYIYRGTYITQEQFNSLKDKVTSTFKQGLIVADQEYKSKRQISSWSTYYYNAATFAQSTASRKKGVPIVIRTKAENAELFFNSFFMDKISGQYEHEVLNATNPIKADIMIIIDDKDEFENIEDDYLHTKMVYKEGVFTMDWWKQTLK